MHSRYNYYEPEFDQDVDEYVEGESEMLVEELDPNYEPSKQEIERYAVDLLEMRLPEDEPLLYLAREALKAPLPDTWNAFQRPNEDVYYKHKVTQQKIEEHPIDIQYRKRYLQEKEKAARKTLKSKVPLKNMPLSYGPNNPVMNDFLEPKRQQMMMSSITQPKQDPDAVVREERELEEIEQSLKKRLQNLKKSEEAEFDDQERRTRSSHSDEMHRLRKEGESSISIEERLRSEKTRITAELDREFQGTLKKQVLAATNNLERGLRDSEIQSQANFNKRLEDEESALQRKIQSRSQEYARLKEELENQKTAGESRQKVKIEQLKKIFANSQSTQVDRELQQRVRKITSEIHFRLKEKVREQQQEYQKISKMIKVSPEDKLRELFAQKVSLQEISTKKVEMNKIKQKKIIENQIQTQFLEQKSRLRKAIEPKHSQLLTQEQLLLQSQYQSILANKRKELEQKAQSMETDVYFQLKEKIHNFQLKKNKNIMSIRESFIKEIQEKAEGMEMQHLSGATKILIQEKKYLIENKNKQIRNIQRDIQNIDRKLSRVAFSRKLYRARGVEEINAHLKGNLEEIKVNLRDQIGGSEEDATQMKEALNEHTKQLKQAKRQLQSDKSLLMKVFQHLQSNTILPSYEKRKVQDSMNYSTKIQNMSFATSEMLKKYNKDVRLMRQNAKSIQQFQQLIKKAQLDDDFLTELQHYELTYMVPELREQLSNLNIDELSKADIQSNIQSNLKQLPGQSTGDLVSTKKVRQMFNDHSKFLSGIKSQLNHKLAQIRSMGHFY